MIMIAFITFNSSLVLLIEGLCSSNPWTFEFSGFRRNRTVDLKINTPSLWPTEPCLHVRSVCNQEISSTVTYPQYPSPHNVAPFKMGCMLSVWSEDCSYSYLERNNVVVLLGTLQLQSFILAEVSDCGVCERETLKEWQRKKGKRTRESECVREKEGGREEKARTRVCRSTYHHHSRQCPSHYHRHRTVFIYCAAGNFLWWSVYCHAASQVILFLISFKIGQADLKFNRDWM